MDFLWWPKKWVFRVHYKDVNLSALVIIRYVLVCPFPHKIQTINGSKDIVRNSCYSSHIHQFGSQNRVTAQGSRFRQRKIWNIERAAAATFIAVSIAPQDNNITRGQFYYLQPVYHIIQIMFFTIVFMSKLIILVLTRGNKNSITELMMLYVLFTLHWSERK